jgi:hypothetical protein
MDAHLALHEDAAALNCLDEAIRERADWLVALGRDAEFGTVASDPRFQGRLKRAGLFSPRDATAGAQ